MNLTLFQLSKELNICMGESPMNDFSGFYRRVPGIRQQQGKNSELGQVHLQAAAFDKSSVLLLIFLQLFLEPWQSPFGKQMHYRQKLTRISSKQIKDLNTRVDTIQLLEENTERTLWRKITATSFFDPSPGIMEIKTKINGTYSNAKVFA